MRLLVDAQLPPTLTQSFVSKGHDAVCDESLPLRPLKLDFLRMATIAEVEKLALDLPETERAVLAAHLLGSLPSVLHDEDEGIAEALPDESGFQTCCGDPLRGQYFGDLPGGGETHVLLPCSTTCLIRFLALRFRVGMAFPALRVSPIKPSYSPA